MSSRVQKGGTLFRPVVKSRARTANNASRQPSASLGEQLRSESTQEATLAEDPLFLQTKSQNQDSQESSATQQPDSETVHRSSVVPEETCIAPRQPTLPPAVGPSLIGIPIGPIRRSTPIVVEARNAPSTRFPSLLGSASANSIGINPACPVDLTTNATSLTVESTQVDNSRTVDPDSSPSSRPPTDPPRSTTASANSHSAPTPAVESPPKDASKGKGRRRKSQEDDGTNKRKRRKAGSQEGDVENTEEALPSKQPRSRASSSTPRPRKRAPSPPPYDPDADPGEDIDPTTVTMASLCSDTGQGRVSKKAAEILSNHAAWKIKNREKRARMKLLMEAKKYGRDEEEAELNAESGAAENNNTLGQDQGSAASSNAPAVTDDTGSGFDYSQDLTTSRFNVQVRIGPNGETVIDENSLVVDRAEDDGTENYTHVVESDHTKFVNSGTYGKRYRGSRWSAEETELFYDALSQYGENYELIAYVLPGRDRKSCKNKFKVEDKRNHARVNHCLNNSIPVDMKTLSRMTGKDFTGPVPEIRAPTPLPPIPPTADEPVESTQGETVKKRSRSKSRGLDSGVTVIGDAETFS